MASPERAPGRRPVQCAARLLISARTPPGSCNSNPVTVAGCGRLHRRLKPLDSGGSLAPRLALGIRIALAFAALQPGGKGLILHAAQGRELRPAQSAALVFIKNPLALLARAVHPAQDIGLDEGGSERSCGRNQTGRRCHRQTYYDVYDFIEQWCLGVTLTIDAPTASSNAFR